MCIIIILLVFNSLVHCVSDAIGSYGSALVTCPSGVTYETGVRSSSGAYYVANSTLSTVSSFDTSNFTSNIKTSSTKFIYYNVSIGSDSESTRETVTKSLSVFGVTYNALFYFKHLDDSHWNTHYVYINESSSNTGAIFSISSGRNGFVNTIAFEHIHFGIYNLYHPIISSDCGSDKYTAIYLKYSTITGSMLDKTMNDIDYIFGGSSISMENSQFSEIRVPMSVVKATSFLSINNVVFDFIRTYFSYDPQRSVIAFETEDGLSDYYISLTNITAEPATSQDVKYSWNYFLDIDTNMVAPTNLCGINYNYKYTQIIDINRYGLNQDQYSFYNFSYLGAGESFNISDENTEYIRGYVKQMVKPYALKRELNDLHYFVATINTDLKELIENVSKLQGGSTGGDDTSSSEIEKVKELIQTLNDSLLSVEEMVSSLNSTVLDMEDEVSSLTELMPSIVTEITKLKECIQYIMNSTSSSEEHKSESSSGSSSSTDTTLEVLVIVALVLVMANIGFTIVLCCGMRKRKLEQIDNDNYRRINE